MISDKAIVKRVKIAHAKLFNASAANHVIVNINRLNCEAIALDRERRLSTHWRIMDHGRQKIIFKYMIKLTPRQKRGLCNGDVNKVH
jgi:hypothetical protein